MKKWLVPVVVIALALFFYSRKVSKIDEAPIENENSPALVDAEIVELGSQPQSPQSDQATGDVGVAQIAGSRTPVPTGSMQSLLKIKTPTKEDIRKQVQANPHITPMALVEFSVQISDKMELAMASAESAKVLFAELDACATNKVEATAIQAICIVNARRIHNKFPETDFKKLIRNANPESVKQADFLE